MAAAAKTSVICRDTPSGRCQRRGHSLVVDSSAPALAAADTSVRIAYTTVRAARPASRRSTVTCPQPGLNPPTKLRSARSPGAVNRIPARGQPVQENFQECYHCSTIHPELVDTLPQFRNLAGGAPVTYDTNGYLFAEHKDSFSVSGSTVLPRLPGLEDHDDRKYYGMVMRPNCFLSLLPDHVIAHRFEPVSAEVTKVVCEWLFPPSTVAGYDLSNTVELFHRVNEQDFARVGMVPAEHEVPRLRPRRGAGAVRAGDHRPLVLPVVPGMHGARRDAVTAFSTRLSIGLEDCTETIADLGQARTTERQ